MIGIPADQSFFTASLTRSLRLFLGSGRSGATMSRRRGPMVVPRIGLDALPMSIETDPPAHSSRADDVDDPVRDLLARVRQLEAAVAQLSDLRRRSHFAFHHPLDVQESTFPPRFDPPVIVAGEALPLPPASARAGYAPDDDALYLKWGKFDHDFITGIARRYLDLERPLRILDFGCSSGRVLRHFEAERQSAGWRIHGVDTQAVLVEWLRSFWPPEYEVCATNEVLPILPFEDNYFDIVYGISVFTHVKYLWDAWLCELRRCLKPGGLCLQTVHCEEAWGLYARGDAEWQLSGAPDYVRQHPQMDVDYLLFNVSTTRLDDQQRVLPARCRGEIVRPLPAGARGAGAARIQLPALARHAKAGIAGLVPAIGVNNVKQRCLKKHLTFRQ